ncbi:hypothetical protein [Longitalea arenae]|uniref:hypothetical protein n=1 Tax=Longitalea arenae TaxID=2812558 RepID=UPI001967712A|nr:hypothetical protein [Longitalea arenae]
MRLHCFISAMLLTATIYVYGQPELTREDTLPAQKAKDPANRKRHVKDGIATKQEFIAYDVQNSEFVSIPSCIKEGSAVIIKYLNVNPWAVSSSPVFTAVNANYNNGIAALQTGLAAVAGAKGAGDKTDSTAALTGDAKDNKNKDARRFTKLKAGFLINIERGWLQLKREAIDLKGIMTIDTLMKQAAANAALYTPQQMQAAFLAPVKVYGVNSVEEITSIVKTKVDGILEKTQKVEEEILGLQNVLDLFSSVVSTAEREATQKLINDLRKKNSEITAIYLDPTLLANAAVMQANAQNMLSVPFSLRPRKIGNASGDYIEFSDELKDQRGAVITTIEPQRIKTYGGARVNASVGLAVNIGGNDAEYQFRKNPKDATDGPDTALVELYTNKKNNLYQFSPVINVHWYRTTCHAIQTMFTIGLSPDFSTLAKSRLFIGAGLGFPSSIELTRRLVVSGGVSIGYAERIKPEYKDWPSYKRFEEIESTELTKKVLRLGGFLSVSFNFSSAPSED